MMYHAGAGYARGYDDDDNAKLQYTSLLHYNTH